MWGTDRSVYVCLLQIVSDDEMEVYASRMSLGESGTPVKKLERSMKHSINVEAIPASLKQSEGAVFLFKEKEKSNGAREENNNGWTSRLDLPLHSNGDSRRMLEPPLTAPAKPPTGLRKSVLSHEAQIIQSTTNSPRLGHSNQVTAFSNSLDRTSSISSTWSSLDGHITDDFVDFNEAEARFLEANREYCQTLSLDDVRRDQYPDLGLQRQTYMDHANFALSSKFQVLRLGCYSTLRRVQEAIVRLELRCEWPLFERCKIGPLTDRSSYGT